MQSINEVLVHDVCVSCNKVTEELITAPVQNRQYYVEGAGQLCKTCYEKIYS